LLKLRMVMQVILKISRCITVNYLFLGWG